MLGTELEYSGRSESPPHLQCQKIKTLISFGGRQGLVDRKAHRAWIRENLDSVGRGLLRVVFESEYKSCFVFPASSAAQL